MNKTIEQTRSNLSNYNRSGWWLNLYRLKHLFTEMKLKFVELTLTKALTGPPQHRHVVFVHGGVVGEGVGQFGFAVNDSSEQIGRKTAVYNQIVWIVIVTCLDDESFERVTFGYDGNVEQTTADSIHTQRVRGVEIALRIGIMTGYEWGTGHFRCSAGASVGRDDPTQCGEQGKEQSYEWKW